MHRYVIVGGGAGGAAVAARLRRLNENAVVEVYERGPHISYASCGLPYYIGGSISQRDRLFIKTPEDFSARFKVDVFVNTEVVDIDPASKTITVKNLADGKTSERSYDKCILSPGAEPVRPPIPGIDSEGVFALRTVPDSDRINNFIEKNRPESAVIIGAGFIGLEMAENLHHRGLEVSVVEMADHVLTPVDEDTASIVHHTMKMRNVEFRTGEMVKEIEKGLKVKLGSGEYIETDMVVVSAGVKPDVDIAGKAGLKIGRTGGIYADDYMGTSDPDVFALGDGVETVHPVTGQRLICYLAGPAAKQARVVAHNVIYGKSVKYSGALGSSIVKLWDLTVARTGASEDMLKSAGIDYLTVADHPYQHAGYYPYPLLMCTKMHFESGSGRILGGQAVGIEGVDKRVDVISTVMGMGGTIRDLANMEQSYAPPYSSAKDPVNMLGFMAENIMSGLVSMIQCKDIKSIKEEERFILDVRTPDEYVLGAVEGAVNIELDTLRSHLDEIPRDKTIIVCCEAGLRAYVACRILKANGFENVFDLTGGFSTWIYSNQKPVYKRISATQRTEDGAERINLSGFSLSEVLLTLRVACGKKMDGDVIVFVSQEKPEKDSCSLIEEFCRINGHTVEDIKDNDSIWKVKITI